MKIKFLLLVLSLGISFILFTENADATSDYDDVIHQGTAVITCYNGTMVETGELDVRATYERLIRDEGNQTFNNYLDAAKNNGQGWALVNHHYEDEESGDRYSAVNLHVATAPPSSVDFVSLGTTVKYVAFNDSVRASITCEEPGDPHVTVYPNIADWAIAGATVEPIFINAPINYPTGYAGELVPTEMPPAKYVAMGDSFSSGEGNPSFEVGTDESGVNECHRSYEAYPRLLQSDSNLNIGSTAFVACAGATTSDITSGDAGDSSDNWGEGPQVNALSTDTEVVTITIGGNDVGFKNFATACAITLCNFSTSAYSDIQYKIANELPDKLDEVMTAIDTKTSSTARIYVVGYPHIAPETMPTGMGSACSPLNGQLDDPDPTKNDGATVRDVVDQLNGVIDAVVNDFSSPKFTFIDPNDIGSPFIGHDWCEQDRYFQIITYNQVEYSFHPNRDGHDAYATIVGGLL